MKKIMNLIKNEYIKQLKKVSIWIVAGLILVFSFAVPLIAKAMDVWSERRFSNYSVYQYIIESQQEQIERQKAELGKHGEEVDRQIQDTIDMMQREIEIYKKAISYGVKSTDDWRGSVINEISALDQQISVYEKALESGDYSGIWNYVDYDSKSDIVTIEKPDSQEITREQVEAGLAKLKKDHDAKWEVIKTNDYTIMINQTIASIKEQIKSGEEQIKQLEKQLETSPTDKELVKELNNQKNQLAMNKRLLELNQFRLAEKISYDRGWKRTTFEYISNLINRVYYETPMTEEEYQLEEYSQAKQLGLSYEQYVKQQQKKIRGYEDDILIYRYSLENNIPTYDIAGSTRSRSTWALQLVIMVTLFGVLISSALVSKEYSTGSIRLLLIRPVKRWKILFSKYVMLLSFCLFMLIGLCLSMLFGSIIANGVGDLGVPVLSVQGGKVMEINFFLWLFGKLLFCGISTLFAVSLSFMMSTLVKNTALAVILGAGAVLCPLPATALATLLQLSKIIVYTPIPYLNLSSFALGTDSNILYQLLGGGVPFHVTLGVVMMLVLTAAFVVSSFLVFNRRDVKN